MYEWQPTHIVDAMEQVAQFGTAGPGQAALLDVGTDDYRAYFQREVLDSLVFCGGSTCRFFRGSYGVGKTHLLGLLESQATQAGMAVVRTVLDDSTKLENWKQITQYILQCIEVHTEPGRFCRGVPAIIEWMRGTGSLQVDQLREVRLPHPGMQRALILAAEGGLTADGHGYLARYLLGERVRVADLRAAGIAGVKEALSARNAELFLNSAVLGLHSLGLPGVMLLMDENENTLVWRGRSQPPKRIISAANLMRRMVDATSTGLLPGFIAVFSVLPTFVELATEAYEALGQRLSVRPDELGSPWRWPVCDVEAMNQYMSPREFSGALGAHMASLAEQCGASASALAPMLNRAGTQILTRQAGPGYRRELMKAFASMCVEAIEETM